MEIAAESALGTTLLGNLMVANRPLATPAVLAFMHYDLGYFDDETCRLEPIDNPFGPAQLRESPRLANR